MTGTEVEVQRVVNGVVSTELDQRVAAFEEATKTLDWLVISGQAAPSMT